MTLKAKGLGPSMDIGMVLEKDGKLKEFDVQ